MTDIDEIIQKAEYQGMSFASTSTSSIWKDKLEFTFKLVGPKVLRSTTIHIHIHMVLSFLFSYFSFIIGDVAGRSGAGIVVSVRVGISKPVVSVTFLVIFPLKISGSNKIDICFQEILICIRPPRNYCITLASAIQYLNGEFLSFYK